MFDKPEVIRFRNGKMEVNRNYIWDEEWLYAQKEQYCYAIEQYEYYFFLAKRGFKDSCIQVDMQFRQIIEASSKGFTLLEKRTWKNPLPITRLLYNPL